MPGGFIERSPGFIHLMSIMIDIKGAVERAAAYLAEMYQEASYDDLLLEEVEYDEQAHAWLITYGFSIPRSAGGFLQMQDPYVRKYKVFKINAETGAFVSMKIRDVEHA